MKVFPKSEKIVCIITAAVLITALLAAVLPVPAAVYADDASEIAEQVEPAGEDASETENEQQAIITMLLTSGYTPYVLVTLIMIIVTFIRMKINQHRKDE